MGMIDQQWIFLQNLAKLIQFAQTKGYVLTAGEMWRPEEMQAIYFAKGLTKTKHSRHQDRLAVDLNLFINRQWKQDKESYKELADYWRGLHPDNVSGYDWNWDFNHFEMNLKT